MNERIRELAEQANNDVSGNAFSMARYNEKFAELIVRECLTIINDSKEYKTPQDGWSEWDAGWNPALEQAEENIKQHFGVEE